MKFMKMLLLVLSLISIIRATFLSNSNKEIDILVKKNNVFTDLQITDIKDKLRLINETISKDNEFKGKSWKNTAYITDTFGPRLWGSKSLELAVQEMKKMMEKDGLENPSLEDVPDVKVWTRGNEYLTLMSPRKFPMNIPMTGLGLSIGGDITGDIVLVKDFEDLKTKDVTDKIVFFNKKWINYDENVDIRVNGPSKAAEKGAKAAIIRSIAPTTWATPHTGMLIYKDGVKKIPACAISLEDADMFERMINRGQKITVRLYMEAKFEDQTTTAHNILAELKGSEKPEEILLMGGHIDSWDVGPQTGATDDLAGFYLCYEALRVLTKLNLRPKRTIRLIGWSGEEMGQSNNGAHVYVNNRKDQIKNHVLAFESDLGATNISGFGFSGSEKAYEIVDYVKDFFKEYNMNKLDNSGENADVNPLFNLGVPTMRNIVEQTPDAQEYFITHHTAADTMNALNPDDMDRNVMGIAGMMYTLANLNQRLPSNNESSSYLNDK